MSSTLPPYTVCEQARLSRDARFDGLFFTAVTSTGIYCRPVCPAPQPKRENIDYYPNAAAAEAAGFRPCLRCRPELAPGDGSWRRGDEIVARALKLIDAGELVEQPVSALAQRVGLSERQLRRLFVDRLGAAPLGVHATRRLLFAKQLLTETPLPITEIALASGFGSLRRFNTAFRDAYRLAPRDLRRRPASAADEPLTLRLGYRPPYDFAFMLAFLRGRALPGVEAVDDTSYARVFGTADAPGWLRVSQWEPLTKSGDSAHQDGSPANRSRQRSTQTIRYADDEHALRLQLHCPQPSAMLDVVARVRRMFDLDADPDAITSAFGADQVLAPLVAQRPGLRLPSGWDGFEIAVRAVLGQQVTVAAARTLALRIAERFGTRLATPFGAHLAFLFPTADVLADADLSTLGITRARAATIRTLSQALLDGTVDFDPARTLPEFVERWVALPGIGPWTANYMALRALGHPDAFPAEDIVLQRAVVPGMRLTPKALTARAEAWRPWRAYAVIQLWKHWMDARP